MKRKGHLDITGSRAPITRARRRNSSKKEKKDIEMENVVNCFFVKGCRRYDDNNGQAEEDPEQTSHGDDNFTIITPQCNIIRWDSLPV